MLSEIVAFIEHKASVCHQSSAQPDPTPLEHGRAPSEHVCAQPELECAISDDGKMEMTASPCDRVLGLSEVSETKRENAWSDVTAADQRDLDTGRGLLESDGSVDGDQANGRLSASKNQEVLVNHESPAGKGLSGMVEVQLSDFLCSLLSKKSITKYIPARAESLMCHLSISAMMSTLTTHCGNMKCCKRGLAIHLHIMSRLGKCSCEDG